MEYTVQDLSYCEIGVHATADLERIRTKRAEVVTEFKQAPVPGFRPGRATVEATRLRYKAQIETRLREVLAENSFYEAVNEKKLKPLGMPQFSSITFTGSNFECDFTLKVKPEFELKGYRDFQIPKPDSVISANDLSERIIQDVRERNGETIPFQDDEFIQRGDSVLLDYDGSVDGKSDPNLSAKKELLTIGRSPIPEFDDNLLGMRVGETREFDLVAPQNSSSEFMNKTIHFVVTLAMGSKTNPAALDDELARRMNFDSAEALRSHSLQIASGRVLDYETKHIVGQVSNRLIENHDFKIPAWLVSSEAQLKAKFLKKDWETMPDQDKEKLLVEADRSVRLSLILEKVRESEPDSQLTNEETNTLLRQQLVQLQERQERDQRQDKDQKPGTAEGVEKLIEELRKSGSLPMLVGRIHDEFCLGFLAKTSQILE